MTKLIRLEANDPEIGGFAIFYPSGACKSAHWRSQAPLTDTLAAAKQYATACLQGCLDEQRLDDAERTNWASVTAAIQRICMDWSDLRRRQLYAAVDNPPPATLDPPTTSG